MSRLKIAFYISLVATAFSVLGFALQAAFSIGFGETLMGIGIVAGLVAYLFGGLFKAIGMALKIGKAGWFFPGPFLFKLCIVLITIVLAIYLFVFVPAIPIGMAFKERG